MRMMFEIGTLSYASPATVSRAGIIYVNESDVGWNPFYTSWYERMEKDPDMKFIPSSSKTANAAEQFKSSSVISS